MPANFTSVDFLLKKSIEQPIGLTSKEAAPMPIRKQEVEHFQEVVENSELDQEVQPHIQVRQEKIEIPEELKAVGVQPVATVQFPSYSEVKIPLADEKVVTGLHAPLYTSLRWLSVFCVYLLQQAHIKLKTVRGKVTRVAKR